MIAAGVRLLPILTRPPCNAIVPPDGFVQHGCGEIDISVYLPCRFSVWGDFCEFEGVVVLKRIIFILTVVAVVGFLGCRRRDADRVVFYCAAGIRPAIADIITAFEAEHDISIVTDYAGSEVLLSKIRLTRTGDLYMPGDKHYIAQADEAGMIEDSSPVFYWVPTILVKKGNPKNITGLGDLLGDEPAGAEGLSRQPV